MKRFERIGLLCAQGDDQQGGPSDVLISAGEDDHAATFDDLRRSVWLRSWLGKTAKEYFSGVWVETDHRLQVAARFGAPCRFIGFFVWLYCATTS